MSFACAACRYAWGALVINELGGLTLDFSAPGLPPVPAVSGNLFLGLLGINTSSLTTSIIVLICM